MLNIVPPPFSEAKQAGAALRVAEKLTVAIVPAVSYTHLDVYKRQSEGATEEEVFVMVQNRGRSGDRTNSINLEMRLYGRISVRDS